MRSDLDSRPDLTSWLGGLFVEPAFRGRGHATALVRHVEDFARAAAVPVLWLYTLHAEGLYLRLGWQRAGVEQEDGHDVILMRRQLSGL
jgi:GNAT superfamily N-acetyltransferase